MITYGTNACAMADPMSGVRLKTNKTSSPLQEFSVYGRDRCVHKCDKYLTEVYCGRPEKVVSSLRMEKG